MDVAEFAAGLRATTGLTQTAFARRAAIAQTTVSRIERGEISPTIGMLEHLAGAANTSLELRAADHPTWAPITGGDEPDWTAAKAIVDWARRHPGGLPTLLALAPPVAAPKVANLIAAIAEKLADDSGMARPTWTSWIPRLDTPWEHRGTPRMVVTSRAEAPSQFQERNIWLSASAVWSHA